MPRWILVLAVLLGSAFLANGTYMLFAPEAWYWAVPGVPDTGPFNQHFVRDIAIVYLVSGAGFIAGVWLPALRPGAWLFAACWHMGHALFHVWEVIVGICGPEALLRDFVGVTLLSLLALWLALRSLRVQTTVPSNV